MVVAKRLAGWHGFPAMRAIIIYTRMRAHAPYFHLHSIPHAKLTPQLPLHTDTQT